MYGRREWEFMACVEGGMAAWLPDPDNDEIMRERTLWVFPGRHVHSWLSDAPCERVVLHFQTVLQELEHMLPPRGYYRVPLSKGDCTRLRVLAESALAMTAKPTELIGLHTQNVLTELSMMALREVTPCALEAPERARIKTEEALIWYDRHMAEDPSVDEIAHAVSISPVHLRRLFHRAHGQSPHILLNRRRMQRVEALLRDKSIRLAALAAQVGFSSISALSRATKTHFGHSPREIRKRERGAGEG
jgi:AraC family transcriptional regulator